MFPGKGAFAKFLTFLIQFISLLRKLQFSHLQNKGIIIPSNKNNYMRLNELNIARFLSPVILFTHGIFHTKPSTWQIKNLEGDRDTDPLLRKDRNLEQLFLW